jgi:hypothetical protein
VPGQQILVIIICCACNRKNKLLSNSRLKCGRRRWLGHFTRRIWVMVGGTWDAPSLHNIWYTLPITLNQWYISVFMRLGKIMPVVFPFCCVFEIHVCSTTVQSMQTLFNMEGMFKHFCRYQQKILVYNSGHAEMQPHDWWYQQNICSRDSNVREQETNNYKITWKQFHSSAYVQHFIFH